MVKIKVVIDIPDDDCAKCPYYDHDSIEIGYQSYRDKNKCNLFGVELKKKDGKWQRCVACQSCEG